MDQLAMRRAYRRLVADVPGQVGFAEGRFTFRDTGPYRKPCKPRCGCFRCWSGPKPKRAPAQPRQPWEIDRTAA